MSRSCHSIDELRKCIGLAYATLSPIFDSISKQGYHSAFTGETLSALDDIPTPVIALGHNCKAVCGTNHKTNLTLMLQFITHPSERYTIAEEVQMVLEGGCKWIQLRLKDATDKEFRQTALEIIPLCKENEAFLVFDDRVELAIEMSR